MAERYAIPGFKRYTLERIDQKTWSVLGRGGRPIAVVVPAAPGQRRPRVHIYADDGRRSYPQIGVLVLLALVGPRPDGCQCCHFDGDPFNNDPANLRWDTPKGNIADAVRIGRMAKRRGAASPFSTIPADVREAIRSEHRPGLPSISGQVQVGSYRWLSERYGIPKPTIAKIVRE